MDILPAHIRSHLEKILSSAGFAHSQRMSRFLRFAVEQTMQGRGDGIKEYLLVIAIIGYDVNCSLNWLAGRWFSARVNVAPGARS